MKITSVEIIGENVPADLSVFEQGVMSCIPASEGSTDVPVKAVTNYGETTGSLTVVVREAEPKRGFYKADGTRLADITLSDLKKKIGDGTVLSEYGLGAYFSVPYTDPFDDTEYSCQYRFGHFRQFTWEDGSQSDGLGLDCVSLLPSTGGVQFDAKEPRNSDSDRKRNGNSRYRFSNLRQYLNSSGTNWYKAQHSADSAPTYPTNWNSVKGLLDCFPASFVDSLDSVQIKIKTADADNNVLDTVNDLFFLQSVNELGYGSFDTNVIGANVEGEFWGLYKELSGYSQQAANSATTAVHDWLVKKNIKSGSVRAWWTRSASLGDSEGVWCVNSIGSLGNGYVSGAIGFAPACVLRAS